MKDIKIGVEQKYIGVEPSWANFDPTKVDDNEPHHFTIYQYKDKVALANDDYDYIDNWYGTKQMIIG